MYFSCVNKIVGLRLLNELFLLNCIEIFFFYEVCGCCKDMVEYWFSEEVGSKWLIELLEVYCVY